MALGKINIYGSRIANGVWQILADGGWVNQSLLVGSKKDQANAFVLDMPNEYLNFHTQNKAYVYDPQKSGQDDRNEFKGSPPKPKVPAPKQDVSDGNDQDEGEGEDGDGEGEGGDGDDQPVWHSEFDPWQDKAEASFAKVEKITGWTAIADGKFGTLIDQAGKADRAIQRMSSDITQLKLGGGNGKGGGVVIRVEVKQANHDWTGTDGVFHNQFDKLLKNISGGHHTYLPGPPGSGKSHAAKQVTDVLGPLWKFGALSLGPTTPESRLWGGRDANNNFFEPPLVKLARYAMATPEGGAVYCLDELDNGHPGIIATINSGMANGWFEAPNGDFIEWGNNFVIIGSANTYGTGPTAEFSGRNRLDAATLDRFNFLPWDTDTGMELAMVQAILAGQDSLMADWLDVWHSCRRNVEAHGLKVFVTMRGALRGATMLAQGRDIYETAAEVLLNKLPAEQRAKVSPF